MGIYSKEFLPLAEPPVDIEDQIGLLGQVLRYNVDYYPEGIFTEQNVVVHEKRMVVFWRWQNLPVGCDKNEGERILWVHDIPELKTGDLLVVETVDRPELAVTKERDELAVAKQLMSSGDFNLLLRFNEAGRFWKKESEDVSDLTALAAKLVDIIDGNIMFHEIVSKYCKGNGVNKLNPKIDASFHYAFGQAEKLRQQIQRIPEVSRGWFRGAIDLQFRYIFYCWEGVVETNIPRALKKELKMI